MLLGKEYLAIAAISLVMLIITLLGVHNLHFLSHKAISGSIASYSTKSYLYACIGA